MDLQPYKEHMVIKYRAGKIHKNADALSRAPLPTVNGMSHASFDPAFLQRLKHGYAKDDYTARLLEHLRSDNPPPHLKHFSITNDGLILFQ